MPKNLSKRPIINFLILVVALEIIVISINFFYSPIEVAAGGATGIAILLNASFGINTAISVLVINIIMIILAFFFLEREVVQKITLGSLLLPFFMYLTPSFKIVDDSLLAVIIGGTIFAIGIAMLYRIDASSGGTTVPPLIIRRYFHINTAISLLVIDFIVTFFNIFTMGLNAFFLAGFSLVITSMVMRYIETGLDHKFQIQVMSLHKTKEIQAMALNVDHSLTVYDVRGGYSDNQKAILMLVVDNQSYGPLLRAIHAIDPEAFIVTSNVVKVHGGLLGL